MGQLFLLPILEVPDKPVQHIQVEMVPDTAQVLAEIAELKTQAQGTPALAVLEALPAWHRLETLIHLIP